MLIMWSFVGREKPEALVNNPKMTLNTPLLRRLRRFAFRPRIFMSRHHGCSRPSTPTSDALERGQSSVTLLHCATRIRTRSRRAPFERTPAQPRCHSRGEAGNSPNCRFTEAAQAVKISLSRSATLSGLEVAPAFRTRV
jgi:hypothetical protein